MKLPKGLLVRALQERVGETHCEAYYCALRKGTLHLPLLFWPGDDHWTMMTAAFKIQIWDVHLTNPCRGSALGCSTVHYWAFFGEQGFQVPARISDRASEFETSRDGLYNYCSWTISCSSPEFDQIDLSSVDYCSPTRVASRLRCITPTSDLVKNSSDVGIVAG